MSDRLQFGELARRLFRGGGELVDIACHLLLTGSDPVHALPDSIEVKRNRAKRLLRARLVRPA